MVAVVVVVAVAVAVVVAVGVGVVVVVVVAVVVGVGVAVGVVVAVVVAVVVVVAVAVAVVVAVGVVVVVAVVVGVVSWMPALGWLSLIVFAGSCGLVVGVHGGAVNQTADYRARCRRQRELDLDPGDTMLRWSLTMSAGKPADREELVRLIGRRFPYFTLNLDDVEDAGRRG